MNLPSTTRLETFSDGVFAIITTLLILEIRVPHLSGLTPAAVLLALKPVLPKFIGFTVTFFTIAIFWVNHHHFYNHIRHIDWKLLWMNVLFLFWLCILPFTTAFIGDYSDSGMVVAIYSINMFFCGSSFTFMGYYAFLHANLSTKELTRKQMQKELFKGVIGAGVYLATTGIAFVWRPVALVILFMIPLLFVVPQFFVVKDNEI
jgi:uncharacterized membrane protein